MKTLRKTTALLLIAIFAFSGIAFASALPVEIDINPYGDPNSINLRNNGVIPVAILGSEDFDVTTVDFTSVYFAGEEPKNKKPGFEDVNEDGFMDMVLQFRTQETDIAPGDEEATLTGITYDGTPFSGTDAIVTITKE